jgi:hypothetical protein
MRNRLLAAPSPEEIEGRIIFVTWIGDDGTRQRGYFTEASLIAANDEAASVAVLARLDSTKFRLTRV